MLARPWGMLSHSEEDMHAVPVGRDASWQTARLGRACPMFSTTWMSLTQLEREDVLPG